MLKSRNTNTSQGFTLIEVLLAITILSSLSMLVATALGNALKARKKIQMEIEDVSALRDTMKVIRADINLAYHHYDYENEILKTAAKSASQTTTTQQPQRKTTRVSPDTQFMGEKEKLNFVTLNNGRYLANEKQADFVEVGYSLKDCKNLTTDKNSSCLFRRISKIVDNDVLLGGTESVLLENVKSFKLRYIGDGKKEWVDQWKTSGGDDGSTTGLFPDAVEITLEIERDFNGKKREFSLQYVASVHNPNNSTKTGSSSSGLSNGANGTLIQPPDGGI